MGLNANQISQNIFEAMDTIIQSRLSQISYDRTLICDIIDDTGRAEGRYIVQNGTTKFEAYCDIANKYRVGEKVNVTVPEGDYSRQKIIISKYSSDNTNNPVAYADPLGSILSIVKLTGIQDVNYSAAKLIANKEVTNMEAIDTIAGTYTLSEPIWQLDLANSANAAIKNNGIYNALGISAKFVTFLGDKEVRRGNYGLCLDVAIIDENKNVIQAVRLHLDSDDMFGNPYNFLTYFKQSKKFDISSLGRIGAMKLYLYQRNNFFYLDSEGTLIGYDRKDQPNILVKDISITLGEDLDKVPDNTLKITTNDSETYDRGDYKTLYATWYNKDIDTNEYIGFADGNYSDLLNLFDEVNKGNSYDEYAYKKKLASEYAGVNAVTDSNVPNTQAALQMSANLTSLANYSEQNVNCVSKLLTNLQDYQNGLKAFQNSLDLKTLCTKVGELKKAAETLNLVNQYNEFLQTLNTDKLIDINDTWSDYQYSVKSVESSISSLYESASNDSSIRAYNEAQKSIINKTVSELYFIVAKIDDIVTDQDTLGNSKDINSTTSYQVSYQQFEAECANRYYLVWYRRNSESTDELIGAGWEKVGNDITPTKKDNGFTIKVEPRTFVSQEVYKAVLFYNHIPYNSNELIFTSTYEEIDTTYLEQNYLAILLDKNAMDSYVLYNANYDLINESDREVQRHVTATHKRDDLELQNSFIFWYVPEENSMLIDDNGYITKTLGLDYLPKEDNGSEVLKDLIKYNETGYTCYYKKVGECTNKLNDEGVEEKDAEGNPVKDYTTFTNNYLRFAYKIKPKFNLTLNNNVIKCRVVKDKLHELNAEKTFTFGTQGTSGTDYTLSIFPESENVAVSATSPLELRAQLISPSGELAEDITFNWSITPGTYKFTEGNNGYYTIEASDTDKGYSIVTCTATVKWADKSVLLQAYYPVAWTANDKYYLEGAKTVIYNHQGSSPTWFQGQYKLFNADTEVSVETWIINPNSENQQQQLSLNGRTLVPLNIYLSSGFANQVVIAQDKNKNILLVQPIFVSQNQHASSKLNNWNQSLTIDENSGTILSTMVGAGYKNAENKFSGVLMGKISGIFDKDKSEAETKTGVFGYDKGARTFALTDDGKLVLGASGNGQIVMDGQSGSIESADYANDKIRKGMKIDLEDNSIHSKGGFTLESTDENGQTTLKLSDATGLKIGNEKDSSYFNFDIKENKLTIKADTISLGGSDVAGSINSINQYIDAINNQINSATYFYNYIPLPKFTESGEDIEDSSKSNNPATNWIEAKTESEHIGDLFFLTEDVKTEEVVIPKGTVYAWSCIEILQADNTVLVKYGWKKIEDTILSESLWKTYEALLTAESKNAIYYGDQQPEKPYYKNDIWIKTDGSYWICLEDNGNWIESSGRYARNLIKDGATAIILKTGSLEDSKQIEQYAASAWAESNFVLSFDIVVAQFQWQEYTTTKLVNDTIEETVETRLEMIPASGDLPEAKNIVIKFLNGDQEIYKINNGHLIEQYNPPRVLIKMDNQPFKEKSIPNTITFSIEETQVENNWQIFISNVQLEFGNNFSEFTLNPNDQEQVPTEAEKTFNRLTNYGLNKGIYKEGNELYILADMIQTGLLRSNRLLENEHVTKFNLDTGLLETNYAYLRAGAQIGGWQIGSATYTDTSNNNTTIDILQSDIKDSSDKQPNIFLSPQGIDYFISLQTADEKVKDKLVFKAGQNFGVSENGTVYATAYKLSNGLIQDGNIINGAKFDENSVLTNGVQITNGIIKAKGADIEGTINATAGSIGGWKINGLGIQSENGKIQLNPNEIITTDEAGNKITNYAFRAGDNFTVDHSGTLSASNAIINGTINAGAGSIGNWYIGTVNVDNEAMSQVLISLKPPESNNGIIDFTSDNLANDAFNWDGSVFLSATGLPYKVTYADENNTIITDKKNLVIKAGQNFGVDINGNVYAKSFNLLAGEGITPDGNIYPEIKDKTGIVILSNGTFKAVNAEIVGKITANSGEIAGWKIELDPLGHPLFGYDVGTGLESLILSPTGILTKYLGFCDELNNKFNSSNENIKISLKVGPHFAVTIDGKIYANEANITGTISANKGNIGGWNIDSNLLSSENNFQGMYSGTEYEAKSLVTSGDSPYRFYCGSVALDKAGSTNMPTFYVLADGSLYATAAKFSGSGVTIGEDVILGENGESLKQFINRFNDLETKVNGSGSGTENPDPPNTEEPGSGSDQYYDNNDGITFTSSPVENTEKYKTEFKLDSTYLGSQARQTGTDSNGLSTFVYTRYNFTLSALRWADNGEQPPQLSLGFICSTHDNNYIQQIIVTTVEQVQLTDNNQNITYSVEEINNKYIHTFTANHDHLQSCYLSILNGPTRPKVDELIIITIGDTEIT